MPDDFIDDKEVSKLLDEVARGAADRIILGQWLLSVAAMCAQACGSAPENLESDMSHPDVTEIVQELVEKVRTPQGCDIARLLHISSLVFLRSAIAVDNVIRCSYDPNSKHDYTEPFGI